MFLQSPLFNYVVAASALLDELCWGCGNSFSADLEASLIQMVIAVGEDLEAAVLRLRPMMSLLAGAAQESDHMVVQMKKDVASALENDHRSLAIGRLHQFLDQLQSNGGDMSMLMSLPHTFKDAASAFFSAKAACLPPATFRPKLQAALVAAKRLHQHSSASLDASHTLTAFIASASKLTCDSQAPVTAADADVAALLKPKLLGPRLPSLMFMPVLSIEILQVSPSVFLLTRQHSLMQSSERCRAAANRQHHGRALGRCRRYDRQLARPSHCVIKSRNVSVYNNSPY